MKREGIGIGKGPQAGIRTRIAVSAVALYVGAVCWRTNREAIGADTNYTFNVTQTLKVH